MAMTATQETMCDGVAVLNKAPASPQTPPTPLRRVRREFGAKVAQEIQGASLSGDDQERERNQAELEECSKMQRAARTTDWEAKLAGMSFDERVKATVESFERRASFKRILREVLEYCKEERVSEDVESFIETQVDFEANRQSPRRYVFFLMRTGALEEVGYDSEGNAIVVSAVAEPPASGTVDAQAHVHEEETALDSDTQEDAPASDGTQAQNTELQDQTDASVAVTQDSTSAESDRTELPDSQSEPRDVQDNVAEWRLHTTNVGTAALEATDPLAALRNLVEGEGEVRKATYLSVLAFCEEPRKLAEISNYLKDDPGLEIDNFGVIHMQPNAYISKLDTAGGLWWNNGWTTTQEGRLLLDEQ